MSQSAQFACKKAKQCGGCQLQNMTYPEQLVYKRNKVRRYLGKFHKIPPVIGMQDPTHYRCKGQAAFGTTRAGKIISGIYQSSSHRIVNVDSCLTEDKRADEIIVGLRALLPSFGIRPYDEDSRRGLLRHVLVRRSPNTKEILVVLVCASAVFPSRKNFVQALLKQFPDITSVVLNINPRRTSMVLGEREQVLYGPGYIYEQLCGMRFRISPRSFAQINPVQTEILYRTAIEAAQMNGTERVLDAYCGVGPIGLIASPHCAKVLGAEGTADAVRDAKRNAQENGVRNAEFVCADAGELMRELADAGEHLDLLFTDPPRAGCSMEFLQSVLKLKPARIVYISCNVETQARDLKVLCDGGYRVTFAQPVDLFPYTNHIESVVCLTRRLDNELRERMN